MSSTRLTELAKAILQNATKLEDHFNSNNIPPPSFDEHSPSELSLPPELLQVRQKAVDSALELQDLLIGPAMQLRPVLNATALHAIYKYNIASKVPLDGEVSFQDLAKDVGLKQHDVQRILRFAMIHHRVFQEKKPGFVSHTAASRLLATDASAMAGLGFMFDECYQSFAHTVEALERSGGDPGPEQCGWAIAHRQDMSMWEYHTAHPELGERAGLAMKAFTKGFNHDATALTHGYDWSTVNSTGRGILVDLGGADGNVAAAIARANPQLKCIIQEIPEVVAKAQYKLPEDVSGQVTFAAHDFFQPQPTSADVYLFRQIFHNWSDANCIKILQALSPALKPGAKILINDAIVPPPGVLPPMQERGVRGIDMIMMSLFNSREREKHDWEVLFAEADSRFGKVRAWTPEGSYLGLIEATWNG